MTNICIVFGISPSESVKYSNWKDGFTGAIDILKNKFNITMVNAMDNKNIDFTPFDIIFFKEGFNGKYYNKYKNNIVNKKKGLFISCSNEIPKDTDMNIYDVLFYETEWYYNYANLKRHKNAYHAFGINTQVMKPLNLEKEYDVIFVGAIKSYKRPLKILKYPGKKICLGVNSDNKMVEKLRSSGVEVREFIEYDELCMFYNKSKLCYIPCEIHGGGERAVLEARACGINVEVEPDNNKLKELLLSPIYSSEYYAEQIEKYLLKI
jgi:hypothetical protein